jgi:hypothetical protein
MTLGNLKTMKPFADKHYKGNKFFIFSQIILQKHLIFEESKTGNQNDKE